MEKYLVFEDGGMNIMRDAANAGYAPAAERLAELKGDTSKVIKDKTPVCRKFKNLRHE